MLGPAHPGEWCPHPEWRKRSHRMDASARSWVTKTVAIRRVRRSSASSRTRRRRVGWASAARLDRWHLYRRPSARICYELHSAADARGAVADLGGESVASPMKSTQTVVWFHLTASRQITGFVTSLRRPSAVYPWRLCCAPPAPFQLRRYSHCGRDERDPRQ